MDGKGLLLGILLGLCLVFLLGAQQAPDAPEKRFQLEIRQTAKGDDYWTVFDTRTGEAKVFRGDSVTRISFSDESVSRIR